MALSKKLTAYTANTNADANTLFYIVNDPAGTPTSYKMTSKSFLESNIAANASFAGPVKGTYVIASDNTTPANSTDVPSGYPIGSIWSDGDYVYVVTGASAIKRAALTGGW